MNKRHVRLLLPALLIGTGLYLQSGCIYIPTFNKVTAGKDVSGQVGDATAKRPLRVGQATRDQVMYLLGPPMAAKSDGSAVAYSWEVKKGIWVWPLCFAAYDHSGARTLILRFDERQILQSAEMLENESGMLFTYRLLPPLPKDFPQQEIEQDDEVPTTRPTPQGATYLTR